MTSLTGAWRMDISLSDFPQLADRNESMRRRRCNPKAREKPGDAQRIRRREVPRFPSSDQLMHRRQVATNVHFRPAAPRANGPASAADAPRAKANARRRATSRTTENCALSVRSSSFVIIRRTAPASSRSRLGFGSQNTEWTEVTTGPRGPRSHAPALDSLTVFPTCALPGESSRGSPLGVPMRLLCPPLSTPASRVLGRGGMRCFSLCPLLP